MMSSSSSFLSSSPSFSFSLNSKSCKNLFSALLFIFPLFLTNPSFNQVQAVNNGLGVTPPMGFRTWTHYAMNVSQDLMIQLVDGLTSRQRLVDGIPTSLADLGYVDLGLDDNWQMCGSYGDKGFTYHNQAGYPVVNTDTFPDLLNFTNYAHSKGVKAGWYLNNCKCYDHCGSSPDDPDCYFADVASLYEFGFDSVKLDNCGAQKDLNKWAKYLNNLEKPILTENCHWGGDAPNATWCPYNFFRSSGDMAPTYSSIIDNLQSTIHFAKTNLSTPGCWAYPDMLQIATWFIDPYPALNIQEERSHFAAWCIVSSPLYIGFDPNNDTTVNAIWDIVTNREAIAVNQKYFGHSGTTFAASQLISVSLDVPKFNRRDYKDYIDQDMNIKIESKEIVVPGWQAFYKRMSWDGSVNAVAVLNLSPEPHTVAFAFDEIPDIKACDQYTVRDIWAKSDVGNFTASYTVEKLDRHDAAFLMISCIDDKTNVIARQ